MKITKGISPGRVLVPGAINKSYNWEFENQEYTILIALDRKEYNRARGSERLRGYNYRYFPSLVEEGTQALKDMVREFRRVMPRNWSAKRRVNFILVFVQSLPYAHDPKTTGYDEFYKYAIETLVEGEGDCEDTSILFASILTGLGYEVALILPPEHLAIGVKGDFAGDFYSYDGSSYYYCETAYEPHHGYTAGKLPKQYENIEAVVMPLGDRPFNPKRLFPNVTSPKPKLPPSLSPQERLQEGIMLYEGARFNEAIRMLRSALNGLSRREDQIQAHLYLGFSKWGFERSEESTITEFKEALRLNPNQKLPYPHPIFGPMLEKARGRIAGKLNTTVSPPQASILINGNELKKKRSGFASTWLLKGTYTVTGNFAGHSESAPVRMNPGDNETIRLKILPKFNHDPPPPVFVSQAPQLELTVVSENIPKKVEVHYTLHNRRGNLIERRSKEMILVNKTSNLYTWEYDVELPPTAHTGRIKYYFHVDGSRDPKRGYYEISVNRPPPPIIRVLRPKPNATFNYKDPISISAEVASSVSISQVRVHYHSSKSRLSEISPSVVLNYHSPTGKYNGTIPERDNEKGETIWYFVTASNAGGKSKRLDRKLSIKPRPPTITSVGPPHQTKFKLDEPIDITANVESSVPINKVTVFYASSEARLFESSSFQDLYDHSSLGKYEGKIPVGDIERGETIWYFVTASNAGGESKSDPKSVIVVAPPQLVVLEPPHESQFKPNQPIRILARVISSVRINDVRVYYRSNSIQSYENSQLKHLSSTNTYVGEIPKEHNQQAESISYFVTASDSLGQESRTPDRSLRVNLNERVWASHSWSNDVSKNGSLNSHWERGNVFSIAYLSEGKDFQTLGAQLDFAYKNPENTSAIVQWGPRIKESNVSFALHGGIVGYRRSDVGSLQVTYSNHITPVLGGSLKYYPLDGVAIDLTGSMRLRSASGAGDRDSGIIKNYLHHYGLGIRLYTNSTLNFTAAYGRWRVGEYENASVQIGLGFTF
ncbi:MAG: hypothetical protein OXN17_03425 [Candidatus Poribacteria bacterium]|nr:hypothetical protein [Candidatus Poribacteria bacterium]